MDKFGMISFIIFMVISLALAVKIIINVRTIAKKKVAMISYVRDIKMIVYLILSLTISFTVAIASIYLWGKITPQWWEVLFAVICSSLFISSLASFYASFRLHYYRTDLNAVLDKTLYRVMIISIPVMIISLWYAFNGFAAYITYPIANGISFTKGFITPKTVDAGASITFYALAILSGAIFVYFLCDHKMYQQYGKHGTIESTFLVAFPAGIIGARIWYVIGNWNVEFKDQEFYHVFAIWEGGLTILGGAIMGIVVGVLWFIWRNKHLSVWVAADMIVPTILLAQAIGRLGNFFNCEVHGNPVDASNWMWLPHIIVYNGMYSSSNPELTNGTFYLPLFLIEGVLNVGGYFLIASLFGKKFRKYTELGDLAMGYVFVYGIIRMFLEPLRSTSFNMGEKGYWSWIFSGLFIVFGGLGIFVNHLIRFLIRNKKGEYKGLNAKSTLISLISFGGVAVALIISALIMMFTNKANLESLTYDVFNIGVMFLCLGGGILLLAGCQLIRHLENNKKAGAPINA